MTKTQAGLINFKTCFIAEIIASLFTVFRQLLVDRTQGGVQQVCLCNVGWRI